MSLDDRIRDACHRIEELYYETHGKCYVSFSGGKDSTVLLALIKMCEEIYTIPENAIPAVFSNTGIELGITVDFVKWVKANYYPNVVLLRPEVSFDWVLKNKGKPMVSKLKSEYLHRWHAQKRTQNIYLNLVEGKTIKGKNASRTRLANKDMHMLADNFPIMPSQSCCEYMKKRPFDKYAKEHGIKGFMTGVRYEEGGARQLNMVKSAVTGGKPCTAISHGYIRKAPLYDWSDKDVEEFIAKYNVPLSDAYTKYGFRRTGCMGCPYARTIAESLEYLFYHEPNRYKASMFWLKDVYIAQNVVLPFDKDYEEEREREWRLRYEPMRQEMLRKYRPNSRLITDGTQLSLFDEEEE